MRVGCRRRQLLVILVALASVATSSETSEVEKGHDIGAYANAAACKLAFFPYR